MAAVPPLLTVPHALGAGWQLLQATRAEIISQFLFLKAQPFQMLF